MADPARSASRGDGALAAPEARRRTAEARQAAVAKFRTGCGGIALADLLAAEVGVSRSTFYSLVRKAEAGGPDALLPWHQTKERPVRLPDDVAAALAEAIARVTGGAEAPRPTDEELARRLLADWPTGVPAPAPSTVRRQLARAQRLALKEAVRATTDGAPRPGAGDAPGERLLVDHTALRVATQAPDGTRTAPVLSLAIDTFQNAIVGHALATGAVGPDGVRAALASAGRNVEEFRQEHVPLWRRPLIDLATSNGPGWAALVRDVAAAGAHVSARKMQTLPFGGRANRILGGRLGPFKLSPKFAHRDPARRLDGAMATAPFVDLSELEDAVARIVHEQRATAFRRAAIAEPGSGPEPIPHVLETWRRLAGLERTRADEVPSEDRD